MAVKVSDANVIVLSMSNGMSITLQLLIPHPEVPATVQMLREAANKLEKHG